VAARAGCGRHETPGTWEVRSVLRKSDTKSYFRERSARKRGPGAPIRDEDS
jgi:hypothetical protein